MGGLRRTLASLVVIALVGSVGCTAASQPGTSASRPTFTAPSADTAPSGVDTSRRGLDAACALVAAADTFDGPLETILGAFDAGNVDRFGQARDAMGKAVDAFAALTRARGTELPPALNATFAAAAKAASKDAELIATVRDGRFSDAELEGFRAALVDLYQWPPTLREHAAKAFPGTGGCGPSPRATEEPELKASVVMTIESPVFRSWTGAGTCSDPSGDGRIDDVFADFDENGQKVEFGLYLASEPPVLDVIRPGTQVGYRATTQDRSLVAERRASDRSSGRFRFAELPPALEGGFLPPAQRPLDGTVEWTCSSR